MGGNVKNFFKHHAFLVSMVTLQESFVALIPFFFIISFFTLLNYIVYTLKIDFLFINADSLKSIVEILKRYSSILATISIAYFLSGRLKVSQIISIILSVATFITIVTYERVTEGNNIAMGFTPMAIIDPLFSVFILRLLYPALSLQIPLEDGNRHVYRLFNYLFAFLLSYIITIILYIATDAIMDDFIEDLKNSFENLPTILTLAIRNLIVQIFWFFGINGNHIIDSIFGRDILFQTVTANLSAGEFNRLFVNIGGAGGGLALLIAILIYSKDQVTKLIGKISIPFVIFNINTLLLYSVIVLNRFIFFPFILISLLNLIIGYLAILIFNLNFNEIYIVWTLPVFVNSYLKSVEFNIVILVQILIVALNLLIYRFYIKRLNKIQNDHSFLKRLEKNLDIKTQIIAEENIQAYGAYREIIEANAKLNEIVDMLNVNNLHLYYQPKVNIKEGICNKFEALLRYSENGRIMGPIFLDHIEKAGIAYIIDVWVAKRVKRDLEKWREIGFKPEIGINLHPDTLNNNSAMEDILKTLKGEKVTFEIIERSFLKGQKALDNFRKIKENGFKVSIDDFGIGYSSLEIIIKYDIDELKIDKAIIDTIYSPKGRFVCKLTSKMCKFMNCNLVAEGVEKQEQLEILKKIGVEYIQGYYFSPAIPFEKIVAFSKSIETKYLNSP